MEIIDPQLREWLEQYDGHLIEEEIQLLEEYEKQAQQLLEEYLQADYEIDEKKKEVLSRIQEIFMEAMIILKTRCFWFPENMRMKVFARKPAILIL